MDTELMSLKKPMSDKFNDAEVAGLELHYF